METIKAEDFPRACSSARAILLDVKEKRKRFRPDAPVGVHDLITEILAPVDSMSPEARTLQEIIDYRGKPGEKKKLEPLVRYVIEHWRGGLG